MECYICNKELCGHGQLLVKPSENKIVCLRCNKEFIGIVYRYSLPFYEGRVCFKSNIYAPVCEECYEQYTIGE